MLFQRVKPVKIVFLTEVRQHKVLQAFVEPQLFHVLYSATDVCVY